jgi:hypothetical protein
MHLLNNIKFTKAVNHKHSSITAQELSDQLKDMTITDLSSPPLPIYQLGRFLLVTNRKSFYWLDSITMEKTTNQFNELSNSPIVNIINGFQENVFNPNLFQKILSITDKDTDVLFYHNSLSLNMDVIKSYGDDYVSLTACINHNLSIELQLHFDKSSTENIYAYSGENGKLCFDNISRWLKIKCTTTEYYKFMSFISKIADVDEEFKQTKDSMELLSSL